MLRRNTRHIYLTVLASLAAMGLPSAAVGGSAVQVSISFTRNPENEHKINWQAVMAASGEVSKARAAMTRAASSARSQVESSPAFLEATLQLRQAQAAYRSAEAAATSALEYDPDYIQFDLARERAENEVRRLHSVKGSTPTQIFSAAENAMKLRKEQTDRRAAAIAADASVSSARYACIDAYQRLQTLRDEADEKVRSNSAWRSARDQLNNARKQYAAAG